MSIKVGILTLSASDNCGSLLQAYALQEVLIRDYKCNVEIINLVTKESRAVYDIFPPKFYKHPKKTLFTILHLKSIRKQKDDYKQFRRNYLRLTSKVYETIEDLKKIQNDYDVLCVGSDQVWNVNMSDYNDVFFLPWKTNARKISYAASLGRTEVIESLNKKKLKQWLMDFEYISVREGTGQKIVAELTNKPVSLLLDPTLLLESSRYKDIAGDRLVREDYIFFYSWSYPDKDMNLLVRKFALEYKLPVFVINPTKWYKFRPGDFEFKLFEMNGPIAFLNLMMYAKYVFVQSFHGVVFANIFQKQFFFLNEQEKEKIDFRAGNILELLGQSSQIVHDWDDIEKAKCNILSYYSVKLSEKISQSKEFLNKAIQNG